MGEEKCDNPEPSVQYSKDDFGDLHFYCENCGQEVICLNIKGKEKWVHGHLSTIPIIDK